MSEEGGAPSAPAAPGAADADHSNDAIANEHRISDATVPYPTEEEAEPPMSPRVNTPNPFSRNHSTLDLDDYFVRPYPFSPAPRLPYPMA